ncbi:MULTISPECIES: M20 family metallopeptidase [unclassified Haloferax]|jgi:succinyl-diaminopimelate desuccinylase|uniref:M20 family metallopeptidase n=1 Tax=unclassified Haloferax TaxID=2625095 RepID=UPI00287644A3|nr:MULTISPECIES: M20 family metallopeptidase [unclassified Haloferax]MDS0243218.1 M20 family metallopeptidase [Haloferax sp. S2CR25]MDS0446339.1 M20 family metallopeptidase [Haloferax sp. S2CR25-2]
MTRSTIDPALTYLRDHQDDVVDLTSTLVGFDTQNPPGDTREIVTWVESFFADLDIETERVVSDPKKPNLVATLPGSSDRRLLYQGHLDTVPFDPDEWTFDPLGERDGDLIYGRGTTDMKGAVAAMLTVAQAYAETDTEPPMTIDFVLVSDEEVAGDAGLPTLLETWDVSADACVIGETTCEQGRHSTTVADRGSIWLTLAATGQSAHGSRPMLGTNAIRCLCDAVDDVESTLSETTFDLDPTVQAVVDESVEYYEPRFGEEIARDLFEQPSMNLGVVRGGDRVNVVPGAAEAHLDVRLTAGVNTPDVLDSIRDIVAGHDCVEITDANWSIGTYENPDGPLVDAVVAVASGVTGDRVYRRSATGGGDAKKIRNAGISTVEFGLGTDTAHAVDEFTTRDALVGNAEVYARLPAELLKRLDTGSGQAKSSNTGTASTHVVQRVTQSGDQR